MTKLEYYFNKMKVNMIVTLQNTCYLYNFGHDYWHMDLWIVFRVAIFLEQYTVLPILLLQAWFHKRKKC